MCHAGVPELRAELGINCESLISFFQCHTLNRLPPAQLKAVYLLVLIWQGNRFSNRNLQQIIVCSARKIRSNNSTLGASGIRLGPWIRSWPQLERLLREGNLCTAHMLVEQLRVYHWCASAQKTFHHLYLHYVQQTQALFHTRREPSLCMTSVVSWDFGLHVHWDWLRITHREPARTAAKTYGRSAHLVPSWMQCFK